MKATPCIIALLLVGLLAVPVFAQQAPQAKKAEPTSQQAK